MNNPVFHRNDIIRIAYSTAACSYKIIPESVIFPENIYEIIHILEFAKANSKNITFRGGGTSLSGQALGDGIICNLTKNWSKFEILDNGERIKCEPGLVAGRANSALKIFNRRIGPDPASINSATIGGILANNSSGMMSGINQSAYHSFESMEFLLCSGTLINSADEDADLQLQKQEANLYNELLKIRKFIFENEKLLNKIQKSYELKNTIGYQMNSFVDFNKPIDILTHLLVGSEGTLGFIKSVILKTYPTYKHRISGLALFSDFSSAANSIPEIKKYSPQSVEIIDVNSLKSISYLPELPTIIKNIKDDNTALLFDFASDEIQDLVEFKSDIDKLFTNKENLISYNFEEGEKEQENLWKIRKGLLPALGKSRAKGTGVIIEDLCFKIDDFSSAIKDLRILLDKHSYYNTSIYGHGLDGNIHFLLKQSFNKDSEKSRFGNFMEDLANLVVDKYDASLKAEHSTGRNQAPFVEKVWGSEIYELMKKIKSTFDPENILNRDVIISADKQIHLKNLKEMPETNELIDDCIECGFCEPVCPTRFATLTPRQRISVLRHLTSTEKNADYLKLIKDYDYYSIDTCATDGMCQIACPVGIDTGKLTKSFRNNSHSKSDIDISLFFADKFNIIENVVTPLNSALHLANKILPENKTTELISNFANQTKKIGIILHQWNHNIGKSSNIKFSNKANADFLYFPTCMSRIAGRIDSEQDINHTAIFLAKKAGFSMEIPDNFKDNCCGMAFDSKGLKSAGEKANLKLLESIYQSSDKGRIPVVISASSCAYFILKNLENSDSKYSKIKVLELVEWANIISKKMKFLKCNRQIMIHINCSIEKLGLREKFIELAKKIADNIYIPVHSTCCGSAGDRALLYPEIIKSSMFQVKNEINTLNIKECYSSNLTCEFSVANELKIDTKSILYLMKEFVI